MWLICGKTAFRCNGQVSANFYPCSEEKDFWTMKFSPILEIVEATGRKCKQLVFFFFFFFFFLARFFGMFVTQMSLDLVLDQDSLDFY